jgi:hypothetical protein
MTLLRIYLFAIPVFALLLFGATWGAAASGRADICSPEFTKCMKNCKEKPTTAAQNACHKHCTKKYCPKVGGETF